MSESEQLAIFDRFAARAYEMALDSMAANYHRIVELARERVAAGVEVYGSEMFEASPEKLHRDALEEFADAVAYWVPRLWQADQRA